MGNFVINKMKNICLPYAFCESTRLIWFVFIWIRNHRFLTSNTRSHVFTYRLLLSLIYNIHALLLNHHFLKIRPYLRYVELSTFIGKLRNPYTTIQESLPRYFKHRIRECFLTRMSFCGVWGYFSTLYRNPFVWCSALVICFYFSNPLSSRNSLFKF